MKLIGIGVVALGLTYSGFVIAGEGHGHDEKAGALVAACKMECPAAKTEHEAHDCTKKLAKKTDAKFSESTCFKAHAEHEAKEAKHKHKH